MIQNKYYCTLIRNTNHNIYISATKMNLNNPIAELLNMIEHTSIDPAHSV